MSRRREKGLYVSHCSRISIDEKKIDTYTDYIKNVSEAKGQVDESIEETTNDLEKILAICKATEVNALAIDIKDDYGYVTWPTEIAKVKEIQGQHALILKIINPYWTIFTKMISMPSQGLSHSRIPILQKLCRNMRFN